MLEGGGSTLRCATRRMLTRYTTLLVRVARELTHAHTAYAFSWDQIGTSHSYDAVPRQQQELWQKEHLPLRDFFQSSSTILYVNVRPIDHAKSLVDTEHSYLLWVTVG